MYRWTDPSNAMLVQKWIASEYGEIVTDKKNTAVRRYLKLCKRNREKRECIFDACLEIVDMEIKRLRWNDKCFEDWVVKMIRGADISQLEYFYSRYNLSHNKNSFFLNFVLNDL